MSGFTDVFGGDTVPPSQYGYAFYALTSDGDFFWPEQYSGVGLLLASIVELTSTAGLSVTLPAADAVSTGRDVLLINLGANTITIKDSGGSTIATIIAGIAKYFYLKDNTTAAGVWNVLTYGAGTNTLDAGSLAGLGLQANGSQLETNNLFRTIAGDYTITPADRAHVLNIVAGSVIQSLPPVASVGDGFWFMLRNSSIGSVTLDGDGTETVDGSINKTYGPNEASLVICNGTSWFTVGYGRDVNFVFSEYVVNAAAGNVTLSSSDVAGRMIRVSGTATTNFTVTMPTIDNIYFVIVEAGMGGFTVTFKTAIGTGVTLLANQNVALYSDGTNINYAVTVAAVSSIDLADGLATAPSLRFLLDADTGLYRPGSDIIGFTAGGVQNAQLDTVGFKTLGGAVGTPSYSFLLDANTGIYDVGADILGFAAGGTLGSQVYSLGLQLIDGVVGTPSLSFINDPDTGFFRDVTNRISFGGSGIKGGHLGPLGFEAINGVVANPSYSFVSDVNTGFYWISTSQIGVACAGVQVAKFGGAQSFTAASPVFTGNPIAPTPALADNDTSVATTAFVMNAFANGFGGGGLDFKNKIINGDMRFAERGTNFPAVGNVYTLDRWLISNSSAAVYTVTQQLDAPANTLFQYSYRVAITTADAAIAAGDVVRIQQQIEGYNVKALVGVTFTLSFWARSSKTGIHCVSFVNSGTDRSYVGEYTINAINTWEFETITVTGGLVTAGTWNYTNGSGLRVYFALAAGSTFQTTANAWQVGFFNATANQVNCLDTIGNVFAIAGVQLEIGALATPFAERDIGSEFALCQRYYEKSFQLGTAPAQGVGSSQGAHYWQQAVVAASATTSPSCSFETRKRVTPTIVLYNPVSANAQARNVDQALDDTSTSAGNVSESGFVVLYTTAVASTISASNAVHWTADAEL